MKLRHYTYLIIFIALLAGCDKVVNDDPVDNQSPETHLFLYTDAELSQQKSKLQVHWWGDDKDGLVIGFLFKWDGIDADWSFTTSNDSIFSLPIGTADTTYTFMVSAVDNSGNGKYDEEIYLNGELIASEPFTDLNGNSVYDDGEPYVDLGAIDETPSSQTFPIKNSSPEIIWNDLSVLPEKSFPVMTLGWNAFDLDGEETITEIHLAMNDTTDYVKLTGSTRVVSLIVDNMDSDSPEMNIYINADENKLFGEKLSNLKLDDFNRLYIRGIDNSGASSSFMPLPDTSRTWFVAKPKGDLLIIDDLSNGDQTTEYYRTQFSANVTQNFDELDIQNTELPYESITFQNTIKLFKYIYWYSGSNPRLDLTNLVTQSYLQGGGKIAFSMTFQDSSASFDFSTPVIQTFLPVESFDSDKPLSFLFSGADLVQGDDFADYPSMKTSATIGFVRTFKVSGITASKVFDLSSSQLTGEIALLNKTKNLFFIGLPLHQCDAGNNVGVLLQQIFVNEFGMSQ